MHHAGILAARKHSIAIRCVSRSRKRSNVHTAEPPVLFLPQPGDHHQPQRSGRDMGYMGLTTWRYPQGHMLMLVALGTAAHATHTRAPSFARHTPIRRLKVSSGAPSDNSQRQQAQGSKPLQCARTHTRTQAPMYTYTATHHQLRTSSWTLVLALRHGQRQHTARAHAESGSAELAARAVAAHQRRRWPMIRISKGTRARGTLADATAARSEVGAVAALPKECGCCGTSHSNTGAESGCGGRIPQASACWHTRARAAATPWRVRTHCKAAAAAAQCTHVFEQQQQHPPSPQRTHKHTERHRHRQTRRQHPTGRRGHAPCGCWRAHNKRGARGARGRLPHARAAGGAHHTARCTAAPAWRLTNHA
jgi:hypothetical protein